MATTGGNKGAVYSKLISVSSAQRVSGTTSNFTFNTGQNLQKVSRVSIPTCSFYNNFYNIVNDQTGTNNSYSYTYNANPSRTFTLTPGYYSLSNILALMNADLVTNAGGNVVWSVDPNTNLVSFTVAAGSQFSLNTATNPPLGLLTSLGGGNLILTGFVYTGLTTETGSTFPLLAGPSQVYIRSSTLAPTNSFDGTGRFSNTLLAVAVTAPFLGLNLFECKQDVLCEIAYSRPRDLNNIDIQLTDRYGNVLDLHGGTLNVELKAWFNSM